MTLAPKSTQPKLDTREEVLESEGVQHNIDHNTSGPTAYKIVWSSTTSQLT